MKRNINIYIYIDLIFPILVPKKKKKYLKYEKFISFKTFA